MKPENLRIGYVPYSADLSHPDDRRRFPFFAKRQGISYSLASFDSQYDILILPAPADLTGWWQYRKKHPETIFIFEMVDSLIHQTDAVNTLLKGWGRYFLKKESRPSFIHRNILIRWLKRADIVLCSNPLTVEKVKEWNMNVLYSLDYQEHEYHFLKKDFSIKAKMKLFWEGQGVVLPQVLYFKNVFRRVSSFCEFHVVTSSSVPLHDPFFKIKTQDFLKKLPIECYYHQWDQERNPNLFSQFDCGIIPINPNDGYAWHKPANKLIAFWFSGIPTLTSATPAYSDVASVTSQDFLCHTEDEWVEKLREIYQMNQEQRKAMADRNYGFARKMFSNEEMDRHWEEIFHLAEKCLKNKAVDSQAAKGLLTE